MNALSGIRVVEFSQIAAGPFAGVLLADMGADVIKIEAQDGDGMRQWPPQTDGYSENFASLNRNKRSVVLDLKNPADLAQARGLCANADVVIENFRPGAMNRLGLGYEDLKLLAPSLVYCSISAFGQEGPRAKEGGFDVSIQAIGGVMSVTGEPDGAPVKCGVPISDFAAGLYAAYAVVCALRKVANGEGGSHVDVPMLGTTLGIAALQVSEYFGTGIDPKKLGSAHPRNAPYQAFRCADGYFVMAAGNNDLYRRACTAIRRSDLIDDLRFATPALRAQNQVILKDILEVEFAALSAESCLALMNDAGVPCAPINTYSQVLSDPQVEHYGWVQPMTLPGGAQTHAFTMPVRFNGLGPGVYRRPPALGEHSAEVLAELHAPKSGEMASEAADAMVAQPAGRRR
jgi:crotonobetainyl-CoA:carnitine CoA-transferase CaiB-like acyl-CoA transferase